MTDTLATPGSLTPDSGREARVQELLKEAGRPVEGFGAELLGFRANDADGVADGLKRWRDLGGTHGSILTMGRSFRTIEEHIDFVGDVMRRM